MTVDMHPASPQTPGAAAQPLVGWLGTRWKALLPRERLVLRAATSLGALALLWLVGLQPALRTRQQAQTELPRLQAQLQTMQALQQQAAQVRTMPALEPGQAQLLFIQACRTHGIADTPLRSDGPSKVDIQGVEPGALGHWLEALRTEVRMRPVRAQLRRDAQGLWSGTVQIQGY